jgi:hypothetical protein
MSGVRLLVGTRKGAFVLTSDRKQKCSQNNRIDEFQFQMSKSV